MIPAKHLSVKPYHLSTPPVHIPYLYSLIFLSLFLLLWRRCKSLVIFKKCFGSTLGFDHISAFENDLPRKPVIFQRRQPLLPCGNLLFLVLLE